MSLPGWSAGWALPANTNCTGRFGVEQQAPQPVGLRQQQRGPLVGGEAAGEADGQRLRVEQRLAEAGAHERRPARRGPWPGWPTPRPATSLATPAHDASSAPSHTGPTLLAQQIGDAVADPGVGVHAVGDRPDRHLVDGDVGPQPLNISRLTAPCSWATPLLRPARRRPITAMLKRSSSGSSVAVAEGHQLVEGDAAPTSAKVVKYFSISSQREPVDAGRHRGVGGEHAAGAHGLDRLGERQARLDQLADPLERQEAGVALVGVEHLRVQAERPQRPHAADAEHDLLAQPVLDVAAVQAVGDRRDLRRCWRRRRCRAGTAGSGRPSTCQTLSRDVSPARSTDDLHAGRRQRQTVRVEAGEALLLLAVGVEALAEVALGVQQADADQRQAEVGGRLEVVAGEHAEAAGVLRQGLGDAELGREVGDQVERRCRRGPGTSVARSMACAQPARRRRR